MQRLMIMGSCVCAALALSGDMMTEMPAHGTAERKHGTGTGALSHSKLLLLLKHLPHECRGVAACPAPALSDVSNQE